MTGYAHAAKEIARLLLQINAIKLNVGHPFRWTSGLYAPIYCDNRSILSHPAVRDKVTDAFCRVIPEQHGQAELIAGVATGAIAHGVLVADRLRLPFVYVRPDAKAHGLKSQVEGTFVAGQGTVVVEDLVSTGGSSIKACHALQKAGLEVRGLVAIFSYGLRVAEENIRETGCRFTALCTFDTLLELLREEKRFSAATLEILEAWQQNPLAWSERHTP